MEHTEAVQLKAAERYVLGELTGDLRAQYEDHYFGCAECAESLKLAAMFAENTEPCWRLRPRRSVWQRLRLLRARPLGADGLRHFCVRALRCRYLRCSCFLPVIKI